MKKALSLAFALVLVFALAVPTFAAAMTATGEAGSSNVTYTIGEGWTVNIPAADIAAAKFAEAGTAATQTLSITEANIKAGYEVNITVAYDVLASAEGAELEYTLYAGAVEVVSETTEILTVASGTTSGQVALKAVLAEDADLTVAGAYSDTLTFTATLAEAE